jgi:hypothetical protein
LASMVAERVCIGPILAFGAKRLLPAVDESNFPDSLLQRFGFDARMPRRLVDWMKFLAAMTSRWGMEVLAM